MCGSSIALGLAVMLVAAIPAIATGDGSQTSDEQQQLDFFERQVRPVLATRCLECHGPRTQESGLRLDSRESLLAGGDSGPAIVPGNPDASLLIQAIRRDGDFEMPPDRELERREVAALVRWVKLGAPWPEESAVSALVVDPEAVKNHWAFQPISDPPTPETGDGDWSRTSIDPFVFAKLAANGLTPSPAADRRTLVRRLTFDLVGLPATYAEVEAFVDDLAPDAYTKLVERLLASPKYGERWGRLWLDIARYADTKGYAYFEDLNYPHAYSYRDYVVGAFNRDVKFDDFVIQQIAADRLSPDEYKQSAAALGFLTVGQRFMNNLHDMLDDQIDVVTRGFMGLTVTCARCHDHKYDPIPTADYYSLYGVFRSSSEQLVGPIVGDAPDTDEYREYQAELDKRLNALTDFAKTKHAELTKGGRDRVKEYLLQAQSDEDSGIEIDEFLIVVDPGDLNPAMTLRWQSLIRRTRRLDDPVMTPWHAFAALSKESFAKEARELSARFANEPAVSAGAPLSVPRVNRLLVRAFAESPPKSLDEVATIYARLFKETDGMWETVLDVSQNAGEPAPSALEDPAREQLRRMLYGPDAPANLPLPDIGFNLVLFLPDREGQEAAKKLLNAVEQWVIKGKDLVPRAMVVRDNDRPHDPRVFHRGNPAQPREAVPRQFLSAVAGEERRPFSKGSGRLELAQAIVDPSNPLTARVIVNRVWMHHFGKSLVRTPSDFGLRSERPVQAELLDHLALRFVQEDDWSIKRLHRRILLSSTYRQSSGHRAECYAIDAENNLLWKQNVRRRDFEGVRDSLLASAGTLEGKIGGSPSDLLARPFSKRRTIYGLVDRGSLPSLFSAFDFPNPDATSVGRPETTVPQQTLFMMNHHLVVECAKDLLARARRGGKSVDEDTIRALYRLVFARDPHRDEFAEAKDFLKPVPKVKEDFSDWSYGTAEIEAESGARPAKFTALSFWRAGAWHESANAKPEATSGDEVPSRGELHLGVEGGHAGPITGAGSGRVVVRRWTAPVNGRVMIRGSLSHSAERETVKEGGKEIQKKKADGVRARLISSRDGELGRWEVHGEDAVTESKMLEVLRGDTLDFVVDGRADGSDDSFQWTVEVYPADSTGKRNRLPRWDSRADFRGPQADAWAQFAQALLMTNEFIFVD